MGNMLDDNRATIGFNYSVLVNLEKLKVEATLLNMEVEWSERYFIFRGCER